MIDGNSSEVSDKLSESVNDHSRDNPHFPDIFRLKNRKYIKNLQ